MRYQILLVSILVILFMTSIPVYAQTVAPTSAPAPTSQPQATQGPTSAQVTPISVPTATIVTQPTPKPYDCRNSPNNCGVIDHIQTAPMAGDFTVAVIGKPVDANNSNTNKPTANQSSPTLIPTTSPVKYYPKVYPTLSPTPFATPTLFVAPSATPSAKPLVKSSNNPSFFEAIWNFFAHMFFLGKHR